MLASSEVDLYVETSHAAAKTRLIAPPERAMGHRIAAFVAERPAAQAVARAIGGVPLFRLRHQAFLVVPVTNDAFDAVLVAKGESEPVNPEFWRLTHALAEIANECSVYGAIAYVETDYFGGNGVQGGGAWRDGRVIVPPATDEGGPINAALEAVGLRATEGLDAFDTLGLGATRHLVDFDDMTPVT